MRLEQLQAFLAVAETGSFQQAAQRCGVTQSAISRQIQGLEGELGMPLFHRAAQAKLTIAGDRLLPRAKRICQEWASATQETADLLAGKQPELCVAAIHSICAHYLPPILQQFCDDFPAVQLRVTALGSDRALKVLKDGLVDVAIVMHNRFLTSNPEVVVKVLFNEPIHVLLAADHPLAAWEAIPWEELVKYPQVVFKDGYGMQRIVQEQFERRGAILRAALELNTPDAFRGVVRQGNLVALLPAMALVDVDKDPTLAIRPIAADLISAEPLNQESLTRQVVLVTTRDRLQIPPIQHFFDLVSEQLPHQVDLLTAPLVGGTISESQ
ncbi:MAG TPA: LysR family transcriptional regulator [Leptolyngbyaceae cyanobacterium M33_DOE_097]|uniref:LysR family transcriptional regulator n=1 Tax=Oscillatoriales cyanobacterium SpSt-418 TaxID=2282169 RepID=A0A7C3KKP6_9CYAN|nr:LysR family transcriptional regulator [Leptolyngbyaceae cyanobacterium M33_DOE_097]